MSSDEYDVDWIKRGTSSKRIYIYSDKGFKYAINRPDPNSKKSFWVIIFYRVDYLTIDCFGLEMEYAFHPEASTYITLYTLIGGAAVRYATDKTNNQQGETDLTFLLEPAVGLEWELSDGLHLNLSLSCRLVSGVDQPGLNESDFNHAAILLTVKFGRF